MGTPFKPGLARRCVWKPFEKTSQTLALACSANVILYDGTRGVGKTSIQLAYFARYAGIGYGAVWKGVIFDEKFDDLKGLAAEGKKLFKKIAPQVEFRESASMYKFVWPTGEELLLRHVKKLSDYNTFHGQEFPYIGWNELTKHASRQLYDKMFSINRATFDCENDTPHKIKDGQKVYKTPNGLPLPPPPLVVFATTNPEGKGHNWVKKQFINNGLKPGQVLRVVVDVENPLTGEVTKVTRTQVRIFGHWSENPTLPLNYVSSLMQITDENLRKAWVDGSWDITSGGAIDDLWNHSRHVIPQFKIPAHWEVSRALDWGSTKPFAVCWFAEANGEAVEVEVNGQPRRWCPPKGTLIQIDELYGCEDGEDNVGLKWSSERVAEEILLKERRLLIVGKVSPGPADNSIGVSDDPEFDSIAKKMAKKGVKWLESDKSPGSRKIGLQLLRDRLTNTLNREGPGFYVMQNCISTIEKLPPIPRDEKDRDDVDTDSEDHIYDAIRYKCLSFKKKIARELK